MEELIEPLEDDWPVDGDSVELVLQTSKQDSNGTVMDCSKLQRCLLRNVDIDVVNACDETAKGMRQD